MNHETWTRRCGAAVALLALALLAGCATVKHPTPGDPFESYNRSMTKVNNAVDNAVIKPVATAYKDVTPQFVRTGVTNFFGNIGDVWSTVNSALQGNPRQTLTSFWRVAINTTIGLGGILDPATEMHLQRSKQDFGLTLGHWGFGPGPYLVLPILGPSSVRDAAGLPADYFGYLPNYIDNDAVRYSLTGVDLLNRRANLLGAKSLLDSAAIDPYAFTRDAYLQHRQSLIHGNSGSSSEPVDEERYDLDEAPQGAAPAAK